jgi:hypothetical protein
MVLEKQITNEMKPEIYEKILTDSNLQAELMLAHGKSYATVRRWAKEKNEILTSMASLRIIMKYVSSDFDSTHDFFKPKY